MLHRNTNIIIIVVVIKCTFIVSRVYSHTARYRKCHFVSTVLEEIIKLSQHTCPWCCVSVMCFSRIHLHTCVSYVLTLYLEISHSSRHRCLNSVRVFICINSVSLIDMYLKIIHNDSHVVMSKHRIYNMFY